MGLGLNGGGLSTAKFLASNGAKVTVTDMKDEKALADSLRELSAYDIRYVLGRHDMDDFRNADLVVKNPAVRPDSPYLSVAKQIETDISLFLRCAKPRLIAVTGSKGKSSTSSAIAYALGKCGFDALLGGNITVSPLSFVDAIKPDTIVTLELSSWQLADLRGTGLLDPEVAVITAIMPDHMNRYSSMEEYVDDKREIYRSQSSRSYTLCRTDDGWGPSFMAQTPGRVVSYGPDQPLKPLGAGFIKGVGYIAKDDYLEIVLQDIRLPGSHQRINMLAAAAACTLIGAKGESIAKALSEFPGVEHRMEAFLERDGITYFNDSAATIPQAVVAAVRSLDRPVVLVAGGTDKNIDFAPFKDAATEAKAIVFLAGNGTDKMLAIAKAVGADWAGPFDSLEAAVAAARGKASPGDAIVLSPGCTSFGMFVHEFDRGRRFKEVASSSS
jgi:UDP-N-acetylmuramoylalanine--D-glutamate ligase